MKIKFKIPTILITIVLISMIGLGVALTAITGTNAYQSFASQANELTTAFRYETQSYLNSYVSDIELLTMAVNNRKSFEGSYRQFFYDLLQNYFNKADESIAAVWVMSPHNSFDGQTGVYANTLLGNSTGEFNPLFADGVAEQLDGGYDGEWYVAPQQYRQLYVTSMYDYELPSGVVVPMVSLTMPIDVMVLGFDIALSGIGSFISSMSPFDVGYGMLLDQDGNFVAHPRDDLVGKNINTIDINSEELDSSGWLRAIRRQRGYLSFRNRSVLTGEESLVIFQPVKFGNLDWYFGVSIPYTGIVNRNINNILFAIFISVGVLVLLIAISAYIVTYLSLNPLNKLSLSLKEISSGNADLTKKLDIKSKDEIGEVGGYFDGFVGKLRELFLVVRNNVEITKHAEDSISASVTETSAAIEQISANIESIVGQINLLDKSIADNNSETDRTTKEIENIDNQITNQASMIEESTAAITEMLASLNNVDAVAKNKKQSTEKLNLVSVDGKERIIKTSEKFNEVTELIEGIGSMANTINAISAQTNLLAMNAAIEAAHAGEYGRGFAVVAEEIRKLADSSAQSVKGINKLIKDINASVKETEVDLNNTSQAFELIEGEVNSTINAFSEIEASLSELSIGGQQILDATNEINTITSKINESSKSVKESSLKLKENSSQVSDISVRVHSGMDETKSGAREIVIAMGEVVSLVNKMSERIEELKENFDKFVL